MKTNLLMDFIVDKENNTIKVTREFAAPQDMVWATWTDPELLDQWWGPKPYNAVTKSMEFKVGGRRLYAMEGPEGDKNWCFADFNSITPKDHFSYTDGFCDSEGNANDIHPGSEWNVDFSESDGITTVVVNIKHKSLDDLEMIIEMGFKEGLTICLNQLDEIFSNRA